MLSCRTCALAACANFSLAQPGARGADANTSQNPGAARPRLRREDTLRLLHTRVNSRSLRCCAASCCRAARPLSLRVSCGWLRVARRTASRRRRGRTRLPPRKHRLPARSPAGGCRREAPGGLAAASASEPSESRPPPPRRASGWRSSHRAAHGLRRGCGHHSSAAAPPRTARRAAGAAANAEAIHAFRRRAAAAAKTPGGFGGGEGSLRRLGGRRPPRPPWTPPACAFGAPRCARVA